jgi:hypothetical protein
LTWETLALKVLTSSNLVSFSEPRISEIQSRGLGRPCEHELQASKGQKIAGTSGPLDRGDELAFTPELLKRLLPHRKFFLGLSELLSSPRFHSMRGLLCLGKGMTFILIALFLTVKT